MKQADELLRIESLAYQGAGIAHLKDGKTVFVAGSAPGDLVRVVPVQDHGRYQEARIIEILEASPHRCEPPCPWHELCGGCPFQHVSRPTQLDYKRRFVVDALQRIGAINSADSLVAQTAHDDRELHYRNKIELEPSIAKRRLALGYHGRLSAEHVAINDCLLLTGSNRDLPKRLAGALSFALGNDLDSLKRVSLRVSESLGDIEVALWMEPGPCNRAFLTKVLSDVLPLTSLTRVLIRGDVEKRDVRNVEVLDGRGYWRECIAGFEYRVSAPSFFQTNTPLTELLVNKVLASLGESKGAVLDLYSGVGTFTLPLAAAGFSVTAIEIASSSVRDLQKNLENNDLTAEVLGGGVEYLLISEEPAGAVVVDPPRCGLSAKARDALLSLSPKDVIYVSCDPVTLARDLKVLISRGYHLVNAIPFDLFPQSYHVETVAHLCLGRQSSH